MGQRANIITVEDGEYTLRYDHWCANRLDMILFWGPGYALEYFDAQEELGEAGWLDELWAEGGAILDLDKKYLLWWGGEGILYDVPLRRAYLTMQRKVWSGWTVEWAHRGIVDIAEYVGYPKENVLTDRNILSDAVKLDPVKKGATQIVLGESISVETDTVGCIKTVEGEVKIFVLPANTENYLQNGPDLVRQCREAACEREVVWNEWNNHHEFIQSGFWIDENIKTIEFWMAGNCPNVVQDLKQLWDDWEIVWHRDNYEFLIDRLRGRLTLPIRMESELIGELREGLLREDGKSGVQSALGMNETLQNEGVNVQINPWLFKSHHIEQPLESKIQIWQKNFGE